jgi:uncharacterized protein HemY
LTIREDTFGDKHLDVASTLGNLAALENTSYTRSQRKEYCKRAIAISEKLLGEGHPDLARLLRTQAMLFMEEKQFGEAAACLERALAIQEKDLRPSHPDLATTLESFAALLRATTPPDLQRADEMELRAKSVREKHAQEVRPEF